MCSNNSSVKSNPTEQDVPVRFKIIWANVLRMSYLHLVGIYGLYQWVAGYVYWGTIAFSLTSCVFVMLGVTAGTHRLWSHKCYKATLPLRILLMIMQTMASQNSIYHWCRDHRLHHKYTDTDADPHNATRGFFFSHIGWLLTRKSEEVKEKGRNIHLTDLEKDSVVMFQHRYFPLLTIFVGFVIPWCIPVLFGEDYWYSWNSVIVRYVVTLNVTFLVNSAAHIWGTKPYDKTIKPVENKFASILTCGEGWHNYHHVFPWDYKAAELTWYKYNWCKAFIDFFAWVGWAYDLKTVSEKVVFDRLHRTGDGSHPAHINYDYDMEKEPQSFENINHVWGWDDVEVKKEDRDVTLILNRFNSRLLRNR